MSDPRRRSGARVVAALGTAVAILCTPPIARRWFSVDGLHSSDERALWLFAAAVFAASWLLVDRLGRRRPWLAAAFLSVLTIVGLELSARLWFNLLAHDWTRQQIVELARRTYRDLMAYEPHPFLQYTGRPAGALVGNRALGGLEPFNRMGFHGSDWAVDKAAGTVRIVCLGGSTTASGYPAAMEKWLAEHAAGARFECLNFGLGFYNSNHSVVNFVLNALDYAPDYVVFHHGWNEGHCTLNGAAFRGDYAHVLKPFEYPSIPDALLIRASTIYRFLKHRLTSEPPWAFLDAALLRRFDPALGTDVDGAVRTFRRNVHTVVDLARRRGITPVLVTQPFSTDPDVGFARSRNHLERFGGALRDVAAGYGDRVVFVDLDAELTGTTNHLFKDIGHMTEEGVARKAGRIGQAILEHRRSR